MTACLYSTAQAGGWLARPKYRRTRRRLAAVEARPISPLTCRILSAFPEVVEPQISNAARSSSFSLTSSSDGRQVRVQRLFQQAGLRRVELLAALAIAQVLTNAALDQIELDPGIGSSVLGKVLDIPDLRTWRVSKFPLLWFYFERDNHLDVIRLLGERQDVAAILAGEIDVR